MKHIIFTITILLFAFSISQAQYGNAAVDVKSLTSVHDSSTFVDTCRITVNQWKGAAALTYTSGYIIDTNQNVGGTIQH